MAGTDSLGEYSDRLGLTKNNLLEKLSEVEAGDMTNGLIFELLMYVRSAERQVPWIALKDAVNCVCRNNLESMSVAAFRKSITSVKIQRKKLLKCSRDFGICKAYLDQVFSLARTHTVPSDADKIQSLEKHNKQLEEANEQLQKHNKQLMEKQQEEHIIGMHLARENQDLRHEVQNLKDQKRLHTQALRRKQASIVSWKRKHRAIRCQRTTSQQALSRCIQLKKEIIRIKEIQRKSLARRSVAQIDSEGSVKQLRELRQDVVVLESEIEDMKEEMVDMKPSVLNTKVDGKQYSPWVREASYSLQNLGVSQKNTSEAIKSVHAASSSDVIGPLPSFATQNTFTKEMKSLSRQQVYETVSSTSNVTLKYDGTTKALGHLVEVEVETSKGPLLIGLTRQVGGSAGEYVHTIERSIDRIEQTAIPSTGSVEQLNILQKVANTMTDRCATNSAVDDQLEILKGTKINRFRCAMHPLDTMAKSCEKVVKTYEESVSINNQKKKAQYPFQHRGESNTQALVRTSAKLFHDNKYSCAHELNVHLKSLQAHGDEKKSILFPRFVGNRFHIYFLSSGYLYHYRTSLISFFTDVFPPQNAVHSSIFNALQIRDLHVTTRALGIVGKLVTGPWMRLLGQETSILGMNKFFREAFDRLTAWAIDASMLLQSDAPCAFSSVEVKRDTVFDSLVEPTEFDAPTKSILQDLCKACCEVMARQLKTQLPGGQFWNPSAELLREAQSCSSTNISGERCFGTADHEIARARNARTGYIESKTMFRQNKTGKWFEEKGSDEKTCRIRLAMGDARKVRLEEQRDQTEHHERIKDKLISLRKQRLEKEDRSRSKSEKWLEDIYGSGGLWASQHDMDNNLQNLSNSKAIAAIKAQVQVRIKILNCESSILISKASFTELKAVLLVLIHQAVPFEMQDLLEIILDPESIIGSNFAQRWSEAQGSSIWYNGTFDSCQKTSSGRLDFKIQYENENTFCYMAPEEFIVDIMRGDLHFICL